MGIFCLLVLIAGPFLVVSLTFQQEIVTVGPKRDPGRTGTPGSVPRRHIQQSTDVVSIAKGILKTVTGQKWEGHYVTVLMFYNDSAIIVIKSIMLRAEMPNYLILHSLSILKMYLGTPLLFLISLCF